MSKKIVHSVRMTNFDEEYEYSLLPPYGYNWSISEHNWNTDSHDDEHHLMVTDEEIV